MKHLWLMLLAIGFATHTHAQQSTLDIPSIHLLVDQSINENKLQTSARDKQALNTATESANETQLDKLKKLYRTLQQRYNTLGTAISVADLALYGEPAVKQIVSYQAQIISLAEKNPVLVAIGYQSELQFAQDAEDLLGYVSGLILSYGDINQMKASDRKMLFDYVLLQLNHIQELSGNLLSTMEYSNLNTLLRQINPFQNFIDKDIDISKSIIQNAKYLKQ